MIRPPGCRENHQEEGVKSDFITPPTSLLIHLWNNYSEMFLNGYKWLIFYSVFQGISNLLERNLQPLILVLVFVRKCRVHYDLCI